MTSIIAFLCFVIGIVVAVVGAIIGSTHNIDYWSFIATMYSLPAGYGASCAFKEMTK